MYRHSSRLGSNLRVATEIIQINRSLGVGNLAMTTRGCAVRLTLFVIAFGLCAVHYSQLLGGSNDAACQFVDMKPKSSLILLRLTFSTISGESHKGL